MSFADASVAGFQLTKARASRFKVPFRHVLRKQQAGTMLCQTNEKYSVPLKGRVICRADLKYNYLYKCSRRILKHPQWGKRPLMKSRQGCSSPNRLPSPRARTGVDSQSGATWLQIRKALEAVEAEYQQPCSSLAANPCTCHPKFKYCEWLTNDPLKF